MPLKYGHQILFTILINEPYAISKCLLVKADINDDQIDTRSPSFFTGWIKDPDGRIETGEIRHFIFCIKIADRVMKETQQEKEREMAARESEIVVRRRDFFSPPHFGMTLSFTAVPPSTNSFYP